MLHVLTLTRDLWSYVFDHINFFLQVILQENSIHDLERLRVQLTPYQLNHINLKKKTSRFKTVSKKEYEQGRNTETHSPAKALDTESAKADKLKKMNAADEMFTVDQYVNEMIENPFDAQVTLQFALNNYK
jgi:hypothetical protein